MPLLVANGMRWGGPKAPVIRDAELEFARSRAPSYVLLHLRGAVDTTIEIAAEVGVFLVIA
ncbi:MAG: hypothetical protein H6833_07240 [Planctomycetes bacterium]|nr:hypothetical protein [Planctomycetota bacterium]